MIICPWCGTEGIHCYVIDTPRGTVYRCEVDGCEKEFRITAVGHIEVIRSEEEVTEEEVQQRRRAIRLVE